MTATQNQELTCRCRHCPQEIIFDAARVGESVDCPGCGMETTLYLPVRMPTWSLALPKLPRSTPHLSSHRHVCTRCGTISDPIAKKRGSGGSELLLWLLAAFTFMIVLP